MENLRTFQVPAQRQIWEKIKKNLLFSVVLITFPIQFDLRVLMIEDASLSSLSSLSSLASLALFMVFFRDCWMYYVFNEIINMTDLRFGIFPAKEDENVQKRKQRREL